MKASYSKKYAIAQVRADAKKMAEEEAKARRKEMHKRILDEIDKYNDLQTAAFLYAVHVAYGFGKKRLHRLYSTMAVEVKKIREQYERDDETAFAIALQRLHTECGLDVRELIQEFDK
jgi:hypothetical protein